MGPLADAPRAAFRAPLEVCWHPTREDPARYEPLRDAFVRVFAAIAEDLAARATLPERARYLDIARLLGSLDAGLIRAGVANQFLCGASVGDFAEGVMCPVVRS